MQSLRNLLECTHLYPPSLISLLNEHDGSSGILDQDAATVDDEKDLGRKADEFIPSWTKGRVFGYVQVMSRVVDQRRKVVI